MQAITASNVLTYTHSVCVTRGVRDNALQLGWWPAWLCFGVRTASEGGSKEVCLVVRPRSLWHCPLMVRACVWWRGGGGQGGVLLHMSIGCACACAGGRQCACMDVALTGCVARSSVFSTNTVGKS